MAKLAADQASLGVPAAEITNSLSTYYLGFSDSRRTFKYDDRVCLGAKDAKVTLVEFSDFECPHCARARPLLEKLVKDHPKVRLCSLPFPLAMHPNAADASALALLAKEKGKFWALHDAFFENQTRLSPDTLRSLASQAGLSAKDVERALSPGKFK
jgi:protein-disulfide isomerase